MSQSENRHDTISLLIEGMTCASCVARVEKGIKAVRRNGRYGESGDGARHRPRDGVGGGGDRGD